MFTLKSSVLLLALGTVSNALFFTRRTGPVYVEDESSKVKRDPVQFPDLHNSAGRAVCSAYLSISPYAATTTTYTTTDVDTTFTTTSVDTISSTTTPAVVTIPSVTTVTSVLTTTTTTSTITPITTTVSTSYSTLTTTSTINNRAGGTRVRRDVNPHQYSSISRQLQNFPSTRVSKSCSAVVTFQTSTLSTATTTTASTDTTTTTTDLEAAPTPYTTTPTTSVVSSTEYDIGTVTGTTSTVTSVVPATTTQVINKCGPTIRIKYFTGRALTSRDQTTTSDKTSEACCETCNKTPGCSYWGFGDGSTCYIGKVTGSSNTHSDTCPAGTSKFSYLSGNQYVAGYGPCGSSS